MKSFTATFTIVNQTKGAVRYGEIDDKGEIIEDFAKAHVGSLYLRKSNFNGSEPPRKLTATVEWAD